MNDNDDKALQILEELRKTTAATGAPKGQPFDAGVNAGMIDRKPDNPVPALPTPTGADASMVGTDMAESISGIVKEDAKKRSELDYLNQFTDAYTPAPLTKEEQERRTRAANAVAGVGALGNAANAISNLIFAGNGAPSQTLPQTVDASAGIRELDETERVRRNEIYQRAKERIAEKRAQDEFKQNMELARQRGETEKYNTLYKKYQAKEQAFKTSIAPELAQLDMFYKQSGINWNNARANASNASANASNASAERSRSLTQKDADANEVSLFYDGGQGSFKMRKKDWDNPGTLAAIAKDLGLSVSWEKPAGESGATVDAMKALNQATVTDASGAQRVYTKEQLQTLIGEKLHGVQDAGALAGKFGAGAKNRKANPMAGSKGKKANPMK